MWLTVHREGQPLGTRLLRAEGGMLIVGSRDGCGWQVDAFDVSPQHVGIEVDAAGSCRVRAFGDFQLLCCNRRQKVLSFDNDNEVVAGCLTLWFSRAEPTGSGEAQAVAVTDGKADRAPLPQPAPCAAPHTHQETGSQVTPGKGEAAAVGLWSGMDDASIDALLTVRDKLMPQLDERLERIRNVHGDAESHRKVVKGEISSLLGAALPRGISGARLAQLMEHEVLGLGVLEGYLADPTVSEIMVNSEERVYIERSGNLVRTPLRFRSRSHLRTVIERIVSPLNKRIDETNPRVDARLADGSRVNAVIPPLAVDGPCITIRKFRKNISLEELLSYNSALQTFWGDFVLHERMVCTAGE